MKANFGAPAGGGFTQETWLTPLPIVSALGPFDLDPCAAPSPRPWPTAARHIELPEDGFAAEWSGRVWMNPPYGSEMARWLDKLATHRNGCAPIFARTETAMFHEHVWARANGLLRSEEHTSELQSLMRISYAVFCLKKKKTQL